MDRKGYVFLCSDITEAECLERGLFGGKEKYLARVKGLEKGDILFTYNYNTKRLIGIFEAESAMQENIVPEAWNGEFPWQVRVKRIEVHKPISREDIGSLLKFDRAGRPTSRLSPEIVNELVSLFRGSTRIVQYDDGNRYACQDGHRVKSQAEQIICNWLFEHRITHAYEYPIPEAKRCDFYIPLSKRDGIYIEYWGMTDKRYLKNKEHKLNIYKKHKLMLIAIEHTDVRKIKEILSAKIKLPTYSV